MYLVFRERNPRYFTVNMKAAWDYKKTEIEKRERGGGSMSVYCSGRDAVYPESNNFLLTYLLTPCSRVLLEKITGPQLVKKFPHFMEPDGSLPH
jgi:hypothetical protein